MSVRIQKPNLWLRNNAGFTSPLINWLRRSSSEKEGGGLLASKVACPTIMLYLEPIVTGEKNQKIKI